jgi:hypothetical protein
LEKFGGEDAVRPEMAEVLTKLAPSGQEAYGLGVADNRWPDRALGLTRLLVAIRCADSDTALTNFE